MNAEELYNKSIDYIKEELKKMLPPDTCVYLYGSSARGDRGHSSDIDIAIESKNINSRLIAELCDKFDDSFVPYKVDIVDLAKADDNFKSIIFRDAVKWM